MRNLEYGVILAAGEATRMKPLSNYYPKITLPILHKPLLIHHFDIMKMSGINKIFIVISKKNRASIQVLLNNHDDDLLDYELVEQQIPRGTGHALMLLEQRLQNKMFLLLLGDEYYNDTECFRSLEKKNTNCLSMGIVEYDNLDQIRSGCNVHLSDNFVSRLAEKPSLEEIQGKWCWDGSVVLDSRIFGPLRELSLETEITGGNICLAKAMQRLLQNAQIEVMKKTCKNINITNDVDFILANLVEFKKKYSTALLADIFEKA